MNEAVEAAARGLYGEFMFETAPKPEQDVWRDDARSAVEAAYPIIRAKVLTEVEAAINELRAEAESLPALAAYAAVRLAVRKMGLVHQ